MGLEERVRKLEGEREAEAAALANLLADCLLQAVDRHVSDRDVRQAIREDLAAQLRQHVSLE